MQFTLLSPQHSVPMPSSVNGILIYSEYITYSLGIKTRFYVLILQPWKVNIFSFGNQGST